MFRILFLLRTLKFFLDYVEIIKLKFFDYSEKFRAYFLIYEYKEKFLWKSPSFLRKTLGAA